MTNNSASSYQHLRTPFVTTCVFQDFAGSRPEPRLSAAPDQNLEHGFLSGNRFPPREGIPRFPSRNSVVLPSVSAMNRFMISTKLSCLVFSQQCPTPSWSHPQQVGGKYCFPEWTGSTVISGVLVFTPEFLSFPGYFFLLRHRERFRNLSTTEEIPHLTASAYPAPSINMITGFWFCQGVNFCCVWAGRNLLKPRTDGRPALINNRPPGG